MKPRLSPYTLAGWMGVLLPLLLSACSSALLPASETTPSFTYLLEWQPERKVGPGNPQGPSLLVSPILSAAGYEGSDMVYIRQPHQLEYYAHHRWVDAPASLLQPLVLEAAEASGLFRSVAEVGSHTRAELRLDSKLMHLQQVYHSQQSELQIALRVSLVSIADAKLVASRVLSVSEPVAESTPYAGVIAANRAVARLLAEMQTFLAEEIVAMRSR